MSVSSKPVWSTERVPGQLELPAQRNPVSKKHTNKKEDAAWHTYTGVLFPNYLLINVYANTLHV